MPQVPEPKNSRKTLRVFSWRKVRRFCIRAIQAFVLMTLALLLYVFRCVEFPAESIIYGHAYDTSDLSRLQGHDHEHEAHSPEIIGHRGRGLKSTDHTILSIGNTVEAIRAAAEAHVHWIEIDVRMTADGQLVLFHDHHLGHKVEDLDSSMQEKGIGQLCWAEVNSLKLKVDSEDKQIPTLTQGLDAAKGVEGYDAQWALDIKLEQGQGHGEKMKKLLSRELTSSDPTAPLRPSNVTLLGDRETLHFLYQEGEDRVPREYPCGMIVGLTEKNALTLLWNPTTWVTDAQQIEADILVLPLVFVTERLIVQAQDAGLKVWVWNCNHAEDQNRLKHYKVDGLILDDFPE